MSSFEELFKTNNKIVVLIDALDEISLDKRTTLIEKLYIFYHKYKNVKLESCLLLVVKINLTFLYL